MFLLGRWEEEEKNPIGTFLSSLYGQLPPHLLCVNLNEVIPCEMGQAGQKLTQSKSLSFDAELEMFSYPGLWILIRPLNSYQGLCFLTRAFGATGKQPS